MADINERVIVDTDQAVSSLKDLKGTTGDADTALDELKETAGKVDQEEVSIPVDAPGATEAADDLAKVDEKARAAGDGAKVGTSSISDMVGPFGDAGGAAGDFGGAIEGVKDMAEDMAGKLGLSKEATEKLTGALGLAAPIVAAGAAVWAIYNAEQDRAKKGLDETRDALGSVYEKLREGDAQAAAQTFVDTMGDKIEKFRLLIGGSVSKADIAGVLFGDPESIRKVDEAVGKLDGNTRLMAEGSVKVLKNSWDDAKTAADENIALTDKVAGFFGTVDTKAGDAAAGVDEVTDAYWRNVDAANAVTVADPFESNKVFANGDIGPSSTTLTTVNIYPPANTPIAVDQATRRHDQIQGPR